MTPLIADCVMVELSRGHVIGGRLVRYCLMTRSGGGLLISSQTLLLALFHEALQIVVNYLDHFLFESIANNKVAHKLHQHLFALLAVTHHDLAALARRNNDAEAAYHLLGCCRLLCGVNVIDRRSLRR